MLELISNNVEETKQIAKRLSDSLYSGQNLFLFAKMGAGKSVFVKSFLESVNQSSSASPTYSISNRYNSSNGEYVHYDLYRLDQSEGIGLEEDIYDDETTILVEWAERVSVLPETRIEIKIDILGPDKRRIKIDWINYSMGIEKINQLKQEYKTPLNVRQHTEAVSKVAFLSAKKLASKYVINPEILLEAGHLHDLVRYINFSNFSSNRFACEFSNSDIAYWKKMAEKHRGEHHGALAQKIVTKLGYDFLGKVIASHQGKYLKTGFENIYEKIMVYADARCMHEKIVSIEERMEDLLVRYYDSDRKDPDWNLARNIFLSVEEELGLKDLLVN